MRNQWYGDGRDLVKWGVLIHLAKEWNLKRIVQVAYLRPDSPRPMLEMGDISFTLPDSVWAHFRNIQDIKRLAMVSGVELTIIDKEFDAKSRGSYTKEVTVRLRSAPERPILVFLDPDTGIAGQNVKPTHVTPAEVHKIWSSLAPSDWLVLYQHSNRQKDWLPIKRAEFAKAIGMTCVETFRARNGARDVAFFCSAKQ